jgi:hypothetical protein
MLVGIEKLEKAKLYNLTSESGHIFKQLCFEGFEKEDGVHDFATFSDPVSQEFWSFGIDSKKQIMIEVA